MTDQPPPPSDKKPRRRSAPRKRAPAKRAPKAEAAQTEMSTTDADIGAAAQDDGVSAPAAVAARLDPQPLVDAGDRGDAPASDSPLAASADAPASEAAAIATPAKRGDRDRNDRSARDAAKHVQHTSEAPADESKLPSTDNAPAPAVAATTTFPRQAELRPGELIRVPLSVRWRDLDAFNHVNNSKYLSYLEEARLRWMLAMPGMGMDDNVAPVVAASNLNYRRPIEWPGDVVIELFVERIGGSSLTIGHRIVDSKDGGTLYCDGNVVMVWIDRNSGRSAPLPESVRAGCR
jgi:YbgC/YbaW family acyl-CoA thioester hydrolase